jgi:hypothetical protein
MRGFFLMAFGLVALDVLLKAPTTRVAQLASTPTAWLAKWMDPATPLISRPLPSSSSSGGSGLDAGNPAGQNTNQLGENKTGACPPGFPPNLKCAGA